MVFFFNNLKIVGNLSFNLINISYLFNVLSR